jgi:hypothetical protein
VNPCGGCHPEFYDELGAVVNCEEELGRCHVDLQTVLNSPAWLNQKIGREARSSAAFFNPIQSLSNPPSTQSGVFIHMGPTRPARVRNVRPGQRVQAGFVRPVAIDVEFESSADGSSSESPLTSLIDLLAALLPKGPIFQRASSSYSEQNGEVTVGLGTHLGLDTESGPVTSSADDGPRIRIIELKRKKRQASIEQEVELEFSEPGEYLL